MAKIIKRNNSGFIMTPVELVRKGSFKAVGLWTYLSQLPDDWEFSIQGLAKTREEGKDAIRSSLNELETLGFIERKQSRDGAGQFGESDWELFWTPQSAENPPLENPPLENPTTENPTTENPTQYIDLTILERKNIRKKDRKNPHAENGGRNTQNPEAEELAEFLREQILENYPKRKIDRNYRKNWAIDIDRAIRLDGRTTEQLKNAIIFSSNDNFWRQQILSGANLRKHYDRLEAKARESWSKHGTIVA